MYAAQQNSNMHQQGKQNIQFKNNYLKKERSYSYLMYCMIQNFGERKFSLSKN